MLKNVLVLPENNDFSTNKCAEIFYKNRETFYINCNFCSIKIFAFEEFLDHIEIHVAGFKKEEILSEDNNIELETWAESEADDEQYNDHDEYFIVESLQDSEEDEPMSILNKVGIVF